MAAILLLVLSTPFLCTSSLAQSGGPYDLTWGTVDGGGYTFSTGGGYTLGGTIGQPDAGLLRSRGYTLEGGFWGSGAAAMFEVYLPLVMHDAP